MRKKIAVLAGDGIGPEVMEQAVKVLHQVGEAFGHTFETRYGFVGGEAYDRYGEHLPDETVTLCHNSDAILFGSVGGPVSEQHKDKWKGCEANSILALRKQFGFFANLRPIKVHPKLRSMCPLKDEVIMGGVDILFIRELLGDAYFGEKKSGVENGVRFASDLSRYDESQIANVAHTAFKAALDRNRVVTSVDKANVLEASRLWRAVVREVHQQYPTVKLEEVLVDNCAMQIMRDPSRFDVVVMPNMFGDILTDEAAVLVGSLGLLASASLNADNFGLFEPPGGSAQDIAGKGVANPIGQILSVALMLRHSFNMQEEAAAIENAVYQTLNAGYRTGDIFRHGDKLVNTEKMAEKVLSYVTVPVYSWTR